MMTHNIANYMYLQIEEDTDAKGTFNELAGNVPLELKRRQAC